MNVTRLLTISMAAIAALAAASSGGAAQPARRHADGGPILCLAGCYAPGPVAVGRAPMIPTRPLPDPGSQDERYPMSNVFCGNGGSCVAVNHVAPPYLRDGRDISISVFHRW